MRKIHLAGLVFFIGGGVIILVGLLLEVLSVMQSAWPSIIFGLGCIAVSVLLDGYEGPRFN
ncbi:MAG TPA: hypothetical protein VM735_11810 [Candidatus Kapabacteria bacterium]|nr:hypothetical protein [Candidatus Kapabacteria bacterium]